MEWRTHIAQVGQRRFPGEPWVRWCFIGLFFLAGLLRFWGLPHLPYTHDELSALVRIYPTLWETIQRGVIEWDTHPPGVQVFEWFWTKAFGTTEWVVKLPFLLLAWCALFLYYRFALAWTSAPTTLVVITLLATLQYTVLYAQIARPYAVGLFTTALLADQLTRYLAFDQRRNLVWTGVAVVLSAYTHHFALLLAAIMVATGLLLVRKEQRKPYLATCFLAALAYLPNLPIFFKQLALEGLGWLQPPDRHWLPDHVQWLTHYSAPFAAVLMAALLVALSLRIVQGGAAGPARWFLIAWGLLPMIIGVAYSVWRTPVIQYSMLIFSFPYILIALFSGLRGLRPKAALVLCVALAVVSTYTLVHDRQHYTIFRSCKYDTMVRTGADAINEFGLARTLVLLDAPEPQINFYMAKYGLTKTTFPYVALKERISPGQLDSLLVQARGKTVVLGFSNGAPNELTAQVQARFPSLQQREDLMEGQVMILADRGERTLEDRILIAEATPKERQGDRWEINPQLPTGTDTVLKNGTPEPRVYWDFGGQDFGIGFSYALDTIMSNSIDLFEVVIEVSNPGAGTEMAMVLEMLNNNGQVFYKTADLGTYAAGGPVEMVVAASPSYVRRDDRPDNLKTYVFNMGLASVHVYAIRIYRREGNPIQNALFAPVGSLGHHFQGNWAK